jgi:hypothetical protein
MKIMSTADGIMRKHGIRRAYNCSKYSLGIVYSGLAEKYDTFKETMNKIKAIRMETVRLARAKRDEGKAPLQKIIKNIKKDTINKVSTQIKNDNEKVENNKLVTA